MEGTFGDTPTGAVLIDEIDITGTVMTLYESEFTAPFDIANISLSARQAQGLWSSVMLDDFSTGSSVSQVDTDGDGINDDVDVDDDNDGILDEIEGSADTDGDGTINSLDLDSDGDGCNDVVEAGYGDIDGDGKVGSADAEYTDDGKVKNVTYKFESEIDDLDGNGTKDYLEKGSELSKTSDPSSVNVLEYSNVTFSAAGETIEDLGTISYNWQITTDNGATWVNISSYTSDNPSHPGKYSRETTTTVSYTHLTLPTKA